MVPRAPAGQPAAHFPAAGAGEHPAMNPDWPASSLLPPHLRPRLGAARLRARWPAGLLVRALGVREPVPAGPVRRPEGTPELFLAVFHQPALVRLRDGLAEVPSNSLVAWRPGQAQEYGRPDAAWMHSWIHLGAPADALAEAAGLPAGVAIPLAAPERFDTALVELHAEQSAARPDAVVVEALVVLLLRRLARQAPAAAGGIAAAVRRIAERPEERHRLADLAALAGCSPQHLCRSFRQSQGCTPVAYALRVRLERAARLLAAGATPAQAAARCGWADARQFARVFRARHGRSPAAWRENNR